MLDLKFVRENIDLVKRNLELRRAKVDMSEFENMINARRELIIKGDALRHEQKQANEKIKNAKKAGDDVSPLINEMKRVSLEIKAIDPEMKDIEEKLSSLLMGMPNMLDSSVPKGNSEEDNQVIRIVGEPKSLDFKAKDHLDVGQALGIIDINRAAKIAGARFSLLKGKGAKLERALINFFLDENEKAGYTEVLPPVLVNTESMIGTGQLPKFEQDLFKIKDYDFWLIPTAEVPVTNIFRDEILDEESLPISFCAYTPCFRSEAGSYGKDTRGIIRQHQFNKVELVKFTHPDKSHEEHEALTRDAEILLQKLDLPYRVVNLCSADVGFSATKCYDLEVYLPSFGGYREISSCSNLLDFQARRAKIRFRSKGKKGTTFVHTLNGSALAIGRAMVAILENHQQEDGSVIIPDVLRPYMNGLEKIEGEK